MNHKQLNFFLSLLAIISLLSSCSRDNFEWININPKNIQKARKYVPQSEGVKEVEMVIDLKEKDSVVYYNEPNGFFADHSKATKANYTAPTPIKKRISKSPYKKHEKPLLIKNNAIVSPKNVLVKTNAPSSADRLNGALKLPSKQQSNKAAENNKIISSGKTSSQIRALAFNDIKSKNPEIESKTEQKLKRGQNLIWVGLVLGVIGVILGVIFGKSAFIISLVGVVFAGIGFFIRL